MPCVCTSNTLRLFIRTLAQLDIPAATKGSAYKQSYRRQVPVSSYAHASRAYSSAVARQRIEEQQAFSRLSSLTDDSAIADISAEAIDAIAAEAAAEERNPRHDPQETYYETPLKSVRRDSPRRDSPRRDRAEGVRGRTDDSVLKVKRGWTRTEGFQLHYSAAPDWKKVEDHGERLKAKREKQAKEAEEAEAEAARNANKEPWMIAKEKTKEKYPEGWNPLKRLSPDAMAGIRALHEQMPEQYTAWVLAEEFKVSTEVIQRILRSKWRPNADEQTDRERRWRKRGETIWGRLAELGSKPPVEWRDRGIGAGKPDWMKKREMPRSKTNTATPLPAHTTSTLTRRRKIQQPREGEESFVDSLI